MTITRLCATALIASASLLIASCGSNSENSSESSTEQSAVDLATPPQDARWESVSGIDSPVESAAGPEATSPVPHGYAHTPQGAVQAAINGQVWLATADDQTWPQVASMMTAPGPGRDQWAQGRSLISVSGSVSQEDAAKFKGFKISDYSEEKAQVLLAADYPGVGLTVYPVQLVWQNDDWKLVLPSQDTAPDLHQLESLDGFVDYSG
ncbi:hypothetical protein NQ042_10575 [Corynebacterium phoceense]|uniref:hypothetical protein n=1 Tax=Corynebacterium phoceense TaxID=1686286 RepID=UPI00211C20B1|nr:hypothetical protein [Corynebacterium phoceense]MCQ9334509.1 hypothetical protein [Corynebacterium phoceense]